jgi:hypothetical protein
MSVIGPTVPQNPATITQRMLQGGDSMKAATVSSRAMMAGIPAAPMKPAAAQANVAYAQHLASDDPVFAAIERHRKVIQVKQRYDKETKERHRSRRMTRAEIERDDAIIAQLLEAEGKALFVWVTTQPTTMAGVLATLEHAVVKNGDPNDPHYRRSEDPTNLFEGAEGAHEAFEQFPTMIAAALRQIMADKML